ncbi:MAG: hypothetical protein HKN34_01765, partial [Gammaproteobacteria bacterium]|nr:hypothetical protein [Gammaproteobacteria bacterium]
MLRILCFSILIFPALTIASSVPPDIDPALQQLLATQAERLAGGDSDRTAFNNDLSGLAEKGDPVAQYLLAVSGGSENREKTEKLLLSSASSGCVGAAGVLGLMYMDNQQLEP